MIVMIDTMFNIMSDTCGVSNEIRKGITFLKNHCPNGLLYIYKNTIGAHSGSDFLWINILSFLVSHVLGRVDKNAVRF